MADLALKVVAVIAGVLLLSTPSAAQNASGDVDQPGAQEGEESREASGDESAPAAVLQQFALYSVATETIELRARGLMRRTIEASEYSYSARQSTQRSRIFGRTRSTVRINYAFSDGEEARDIAGQCSLRAEGSSIAGYDFANQTLQLYACQADTPEGNDIALEVALPAFAESGARFGGFSVSFNTEDIAEQRRLLRADMVFDGQSFQALPAGFRDAGMMGARSVEGYTITQDGALIGRIDFGRNSPTQGRIVVPVSETDHRRAVMYMALSLMEMPDLFAERVREETLGR